MAKKKEDEGEQRRVGRCLIDGARYAVATLVMVLTIAVVARAIVVSTRSDKLYLQVDNGYVLLQPILNDSTSSSSPPLSLTLRLRVFNPSGRVGIKYTGVFVKFLDSNNSDIATLRIPDPAQIEMAPEMMRVSHVSATYNVPSDVPLDFAQKMYKDGEVNDTAVLLNGTLKTQITALKFTTGQFTQFYCYPVTLGNGTHFTAAGNVPCTSV